MVSFVPTLFGYFFDDMFVSQFVATVLHKNIRMLLYMYVQVCQPSASVPRPVDRSTLVNSHILRPLTTRK